MGHASKNMEDFSAKSKADSGSPAQEVSEGEQAAGAETILWSFWQRIWLLSALVQIIW